LILQLAHVWILEQCLSVFGQNVVTDALRKLEPGHFAVAAIGQNIDELDAESLCAPVVMRMRAQISHQRRISAHVNPQEQIDVGDGKPVASATE
jgi:hypothetical protein